MESNKMFGVQIPARLDLISIVGVAARECAMIRGFSSDDVHLFCLAVEEALTNSIELGFGGQVDEIDILFSRTSSGLGVKISSLCLPLEPDKLPQYSLRRMSDFNDTTGLSFHLVKKIVDTISISIDKDGERELFFEKYLPEKRVNDFGQEKRNKRKRLKRVNTPHLLRFAVPDDAENISRLVLRAHGEVMFSEHIYYPDRVREMLKIGELFSVVAEAECGELIAHFALVGDMSNSLVQELTYTVIDGNFKSKGVLKGLDMLLTNAKDRNVYAVTSYAVTNHVHSQRGLQKEGFSENALFLSLSPASCNTDKYEEGLPDRIANLSYSKYLGPVSLKPLFIPCNHQAMILNIYAQMGFEPVVADESTFSDVQGGASRIRTDVELKEGWMLVSVHEYGDETFSHVRSEIYKSRAQGIPSIQVLLPLADAATPTMCGKFEEMGFFFAGICPGFDGSENLALQYLNGVDSGFDSVLMLTEFGTKLKNYVRECWEESLRSNQCPTEE